MNKNYFLTKEQEKEVAYNYLADLLLSLNERKKLKEECYMYNEKGCLTRKFSKKEIEMKMHLIEQTLGLVSNEDLKPPNSHVIVRQIDNKIKEYEEKSILFSKKENYSLSVEYLYRTYGLKQAKEIIEKNL
ncbi:MAG: hypothetical protein HXM47_00060 [Pseudoleptotrichia goodfellowii]|nr:hypothetical protein [Pseudoleptotrichia goodfellowii]